jgi:hypothetical protein
MRMGEVLTILYVMVRCSFLNVDIELGAFSGSRIRLRLPSRIYSENLTNRDLLLVSGMDFGQMVVM